MHLRAARPTQLKGSRWSLLRQEVARKFETRIPRGFGSSKIHSGSIALIPFAVIALCSALMQQLQGAETQQVSAEDKEVYLIYSLMLTDPKTSHGPDNNSLYLIAASTSTGRPPQPCVVPPKEFVADFSEVLADYELRKGKSREIKPLFSIRKRYQLLSADEVREFRNDHRLSLQPKASGARWLGTTDLFTLSDVYFNRSHALALTGIGTWCGALCGSYHWEVFQKTAVEKWEERPWVGCTTVAAAQFH